MPTKPIGEVGDDVAQRNGGVGRRWGECSGLPPSRPKTLSEMLGNRPQQRPAETSWKSRFEDADRKRKQLMALAQKGNNDLENLKECYRKLKEQCDGLCKQTKEKDEQIEKLKKASTAMYHEYEKLSNQYNEETGAYQKAMKHASSWYKENQELKRRSMALAQKFMSDSPDTALDLFAEEMRTSSISSQDNEELEDLKKSVKDLSMTVGRLQSELNSARLEEFEAQEAAAALSGELEESVTARRLAEAEAKKAQDEVAALKKALEEAAEEAKMEGKRADVALRDRNTMAHQSALLLSQALEEDYEGKVASALMEIENLKQQLEEERIAHERKIKELEEKLEEKDTEARLELVEEQLKEMRSRAEEAERKLATFEQRVKEPECLEYKENETGSDQVQSPTLLPPPPPPLPPTPPPPPPFPTCHSQPIIPPPALFASEKPPNRQATCCGIADTNETADQGGSPSKNKQANATQGAAVLDDIINQIKGGRFTLRNTEKRRLKYIGKAGESEDKPPAVKEMLGILGTLRKRPSLASMRNGAGECSQSNGFN